MVAKQKLRKAAQVAVVLVAAASSAFAQQAGRGGEDGAGGMMGPNGHGVMGTITQVQGDGFTVKTADGEQWKVTTGPNTRVMHDHDPAAVSDLKPGFGIGAFGQADASAPNTLHAVFASYQTAEEVKKRMADFGRTWIGGKVTAIDGTKITITVQKPGESAPGTSTFVVDESTSFKKGREEVTLADLKAGDYVMGKGAMKSGTFVPTELTIRTPGEHRGHAGDGHDGRDSHDGHTGGGPPASPPAGGPAQ